MLENRELSIRVNRKDQGSRPAPASEIAIFEDKVVLVDKVLKDTVQTIFAGFCLYVAADTIRQILVAKVK